MESRRQTIKAIQHIVWIGGIISRRYDAGRLAAKSLGPANWKIGMINQQARCGPFSRFPAGRICFSQGHNSDAGSHAEFLYYDFTAGDCSRSHLTFFAVSDLRFNLRFTGGVHSLCLYGSANRRDGQAVFARRHRRGGTPPGMERSAPLRIRLCTESKTKLGRSVFPE